MKFKKIIPILALFYLGCSKTVSTYVLSESTRKFLIENEKYRCSDPALNYYLQSVSMALQKPLNRAKRYDIRITNSQDQYSVFIAPSVIIISRGFLHHLPFEASLAFVLAHEMSHDINGIDEYQADQFALNLVLKAGYNYPAAIEALKKFSSDGSIHEHKQIQSRLNALNFNPNFNQLYYGRSGEYKFKKMRERCG